MMYTKEQLKRIDACVNACNGIPTEALEAGAVRDMLDALKDIEKMGRFETYDVGTVGHNLYLKVVAAIRKAERGE